MLESFVANRKARLWTAIVAAISLGTGILASTSMAGLSATPDVFTARCQLGTKWTAMDPILQQDPNLKEPHLHSHDFFGAGSLTSTTTNAELVSTVTSEGNSTCKPTNLIAKDESGDEFDGSGYWVPTLHLKEIGKENELIDHPVEPAYAFTYYQRVWNTQTNAGTQLTHVEELPDGIRMIAGSSSGEPPYVSQWICLNNGTPTLHKSGLPECEGTGGSARIAARVNFPYCLSNAATEESWVSKYGGTKAFAKEGSYPEPETKYTNVAYPSILKGVGKCPKNFDQEIPKLFITVVYPYSGRESNINWELTYAEGGAYLGGGTGGTSGTEEQRMPVSNMHADFMNGWVKSNNPAEPSPLHGSTCVKGDETAIGGCGLTTLIAECVNTKNEKGEYAQGAKGTGCGVIKSTRP